MITKALWDLITKFSAEPIDYLIALLGSLFSICIDIVALPLEIIALIIWKIRNN